MNVVAALAAFVLIVTACGDGGSTQEIEMRLIAYRPDAIEVPVDAAVTWKQHDAGFHTVTSGVVATNGSGSVDTEPDGTFRSDRLANGAEFTHTFGEAGDYAYFCEVHPATMTGSVTVQ